MTRAIVSSPSSRSKRLQGERGPGVDVEAVVAGETSQAGPRMGSNSGLARFGHAHPLELPHAEAQHLDRHGPVLRHQTFAVEYVVKPSSSQDSSNSLLATMPCQYWWPNSWTITSSGMRIRSSGHRLNRDTVPAVMKVGYSMPPEPPPPGAGSTTVRVG